LFQQAIDRQDRILQTEGRFSLLELHWRHHYSLVYRNTTPPDKDSLHHNDMPRWLHSIEGYSCSCSNQHLAGDDRLRIAPSIRIATGHSRLHRSSRIVPGLPTTDINHRILLATNSSTPIHVHPSTLGGSCPILMRSHWQPNYIDASIMEVSVLRIQFVFIVLCNLPQNY